MNPSFEDISGETSFNEFTFGPLNGWALYDPNNVSDGGDGPTFFIGTLAPTAPVFFNNGAPDGNRVAIAFNYAGSGNLGQYGLVQTLTSTLQANTRYTLQVLVGNIASGSSVSNDFFNLNGFPGYRIELLAGGEVIAQDANSLGGLIPEGAFAESVIDFTTTGSHPRLGQSLGIRLINMNLVDPSFPAADLEVDFDHVRLSAVAVPEPSSMLLGSTLLLPIVFRRIRRQLCF